MPNIHPQFPDGVTNTWRQLLSGFIIKGENFGYAPKESVVNDGKTGVVAILSHSEI